jgi:hypothetical protein
LGRADQLGDGALDGLDRAWFCRAPKNQGAGQLALAGAFLPLLISVLLKLAAEAEARKAIIRQRQPKAKN